MVKVKRITLDRYEQQLLVRALYEERKKLLELGEDVAALENLILKVIDAPRKRRFWRFA